MLEIKEVLSHGLAYGKVYKYELNNSLDEVNSEDELLNFENAITKSIAQVDIMMDSNKELADYLMAVKLMISDKTLNSGVKELIRLGFSALESLHKVMDKHIQELSDSPSSYLRERVADLQDVEERISLNLGYTKKDIPNESFVLYAEKINPTLLISNKDNIVAVISKIGGYTSHSAILCRSFDIPYVVANGDVNDNELIILDTRKNTIIVNPTIDEIVKAKATIEKNSSEPKKAIAHDGYLFLANVGSSHDIDKVLEYGFDGIGLFRTEMIFMNSDKPLTIDEQYKIYKSSLDKMKDKFITFRTFDVGDDKKLPYLKTSKKGIENYINNKELFENQITALCKANEYNNMNIMFPMIFDNSEYMFLKNWVISICKKNNFIIPKIGMMLETKEALNNIETFKDTDFISIGTNDLTKELYHINREDSLGFVNNYFVDLINKIKNVVDFCMRESIPLNVCGELAGISHAVKELYKIGIKNLSVSPRTIRLLNSCYKEFKK